MDFLVDLLHHRVHSVHRAVPQFHDDADERPERQELPAAVRGSARQQVQGLRLEGLLQPHGEQLRGTHAAVGEINCEERVDSRAIHSSSCRQDLGLDWKQTISGAAANTPARHDQGAVHILTLFLL